MEIPVALKYREAFRRGRPKHEGCDDFSLRHPKMPLGQRAKIFAPFDALRGFDFAIMCKNELYTDKVSLSPEDTEELSRRLDILHNLTYNSRMARANRVQVSVTYYKPCRDEDHEAYGLRGQYKTITGICWNVDAEVTQTILVDGSRISLDDVVKIDGAEDLFYTDREMA